MESPAQYLGFAKSIVIISTQVPDTGLFPTGVFVKLEPVTFVTAPEAPFVPVALALVPANPIAPEVPELKLTLFVVAVVLIR